ncbi:MAG: regulatory protein RecX [Pseudohongiellaceae bacterium]
MNSLARREHSAFELKQKLYTRLPDIPVEVIDEVVATLGKENLQSDARFVESYVRYRKEQGFAYRHIHAELCKRQVSTELIQQHLLADDPDWPGLLDSLIARRLGAGAVVEFGSKAHRRLIRFLEGRGFATKDIMSALSRRH